MDIFISYAHKSIDGSDIIGVGCTSYDVDHFPYSFKDIMSLAERIKKDFLYKEVVIINWKEYAK